MEKENMDTIIQATTLLAHDLAMDALIASFR